MRARGWWLGAWLGGLGSLGCGYRPVAPPEEGLSVVAAPPRVASLAAVEAALEGSRDELAAAGALSSAAYPRMVVELVRLDERGEGIRVAAAGPLARGSRVTLTGRAWVEEAPSGPRRWDTGDLSRFELHAAGADAAADRALQDAATRGAARALGRALARRVIGDTEPARLE